MKRTILFLSTMIMSAFIYGQEIDTLEIKLNTNSKKITKTLSTGNYRLVAKGSFDFDSVCNTYKLSVISRKSYKLLPPLDTNTSPANNAKKEKCSFSYTEDFTLDKNTEIEVIFTITKQEGSETKVEKKLTVVYTTISDRRWITSFGVSGIKLFNADTYKTVEDGSGFKIVKGGSKEQIVAIPVIMFSVLNLKNEKAIIPSAGFGTDLEDITVFLGASKAFAQNLIVTGGLALHQQIRLGNTYSPGDIVDQNIAFDDLHDKFFRVNPFLSVTLHLDKNIFK